MYKAIDVMTRGVLTAPADMPVREAMNLLVENRITGIPVVDASNILLGIVSESDLLRSFYAENKAGLTVGEVMTKDVQTFDIHDSLQDVCECLMNSSFRRVPILEDGKLAGIISRRDLLKHLVDLRKDNGSV